MIQSIIKVNPTALILCEKPICEFDQVDALLETLKGFRGKLVINENYLSSQIADKMKEIAFQKLKLQPKKIIVEMDKNRTQDFQKGRYRAKTVWGYEGTHMFTVLQSLGKAFMPKRDTIIEKRFEAIEIPEKLEKQGLADIAYEVDGVQVALFTSMKGDIKHAFPPYCPESPITASDAVTRYRIAAIKEDKREVVGFYEPIKTFQRSQGSVVELFEGKVVARHEPIVDDSMGKHLERAAQFFKGTGENPCPLEEALAMVELMHAIEV